MLVRFTSADNYGAPTYINPDHIKAVIPVDDSIHLLVARGQCFFSTDVCSEVVYQINHTKDRFIRITNTAGNVTYVRPETISKIVESTEGCAIFIHDTCLVETITETPQEFFGRMNLND